MSRTLHGTCLEDFDGGIESPEGADYPGEPIEVPPLRPQMKGRLNLVFGMANDEIGYIIPKRQWDQKPPFNYGRRTAQYGEINSCSCEVAPIVMSSLARRVQEATAVVAAD